jgi:hypothetical protein
MRIHGIFSAYLGDDEFDASKSIRRNSQYFDTEFVLDYSDGNRTRSLIIDWVKTFPEIQSDYYNHSPSYFQPGGAEEWRRVSFEKASKMGAYDDDDWVVFVDCTEAVSIDESLDLLPWVDPLDPVAGFTTENMYWPWMEAEILAASGDQISLPVYAFIGNSPVWIHHIVLDPALQTIIDTMTDEDIYLSLTKYELNTVNHTSVQESFQSWTRAGWSPRMFKVEALKDVDFDWSIIDVFTTLAPSDAATNGSAIISYAYARWAEDPSKIDRTVQRPMAEEFDDGWRVRKLMSLVRPVNGLPYDDWTDNDDVGATLLHDGPETTVPVENQFSSAFTHAFTNFEAVVPTQPGADWDTLNYDPLTLLYPEIIRQNRREGLYFLEEELGREPWNFYTGQPSFTAAQTLLRETRPPYEMPPPTQSNPRKKPPKVDTSLTTPGDTIFPDVEPEPTEDTARPKWNDGKWNKGIW